MGLYDDQLVFDLDMVERDLEKTGSSQVQFDRPLEEKLHIITLDKNGEMIDGPRVSREDYMARVRKLCARWGAGLNVRFYGHHSDGFDGRVLRDLPEVRSLTVNSLYEATNLEEIAGLPHLTELHIGVYELEDKNLLHRLPVARLTDLTIEEAKTKALDLSPLAEARALRRLRIFGHKKKIEAVGALSDLEEFVFNPAKDKSLAFLNTMTGLRALKFVLGGIESIEEVALPGLEDIAFTMVRGLAEIGDLQRFPALRRFFMQDQPQIARAATGAANQALAHLWFYNCPNLSAIDGLGDLPSLKSLRVVKTGLTLTALTLPRTLTHLECFSTKAREEAAETAAIEALGLIPESHPDMPFFYK